VLKPEITKNPLPLQGEKMNRFFLLVLSLACLINLSSCGVMQPPPPNPALVSEIDSYFAATSTKMYPGSGQFSKPLPLSVGQYVVTGMTGPEGRSVMRMAVVDQQAQGWVIETRSLTPSSESTSQMLLAGLGSSIDGDLNDIDIIWVKMKVPGQPVQTIEGPTCIIHLNDAYLYVSFRHKLGGANMRTTLNIEDPLLRGHPNLPE
jgi:hypothetical protein